MNAYEPDIDRMTGRDLLRRNVHDHPDRAFLNAGPVTWSFGEVDERARRLAGGLRELGIREGDRVLVGLQNSAEAFLVHVALRELRAVLVPLMAGLTFEELAFQIRHSEARALIAGEPIASVVAERLAECPDIAQVVLASGSAVGHRTPTASLEELLGAKAIAPGPAREGDDLLASVILYTSGSTGRPKGVVVPAGSLASAGRGYAERFAVRPTDGVFVPLPMSHAVGALTSQGIALNSGCRFVLAERFRPSRFWSQVEEGHATLSILFPAQLNLLMELESDGPLAGESPFRLAITHSWMPEFKERFGVELGLVWGMTETGATSTGTDPSYRGQHGDGYVGRPMVGVEAAVMDERRRPLQVGTVGEIVLRHPHAMLEYLKDPQNTAKTLVDGWVHSGDLGSIDAEGGLFFQGRIKNMIKRSGENISSEEIEVVLAGHPAVSEAIVIGVADRIRTEEVAAVVVLADGAALDPVALAAFAAERLARWKVPRYLRTSAVALPRLANGKIDRLAVIAGFEPGAAWDREAPTRPSDA